MSQTPPNPKLKSKKKSLRKKKLLKKKKNQLKNLKNKLKTLKLLLKKKLKLKRKKKKKTKTVLMKTIVMMKKMRMKTAPKMQLKPQSKLLNYKNINKKQIKPWLAIHVSIFNQLNIQTSDLLLIMETNMDPNISLLMSMFIIQQRVIIIKNGVMTKTREN